MDFMRLLKSLEELLYELASWLVFYPMTMWRALRHPQAMMRYADMELADDAASQYAETLSPPLFLLITLLIAHGLEMSMLRQATQAALPPLLANDSNLLIFRAVTLLRCSGIWWSRRAGSWRISSFLPRARRSSSSSRCARRWLLCF